MSLEANKIDFFNEIIFKEQIHIAYFEEEGLPKLSFTYSEELEKMFDEQPDLLGEFSDYVQTCMLIANYAGFEPPSEFYQMMKSYVESEIPKNKQTKDNK